MTNHRTRPCRLGATLTAACLCLLALTGCGPDHEGIADDIIAGMERASTTIVSIESDKDLERAVKELTKIAADMRGLVEQWTELGEPDQETKDRILKKFEAREAAWERSMQDTPTYFQTHPEKMFELAGPLQQIGEAFGEIM